MRQFDPWGKICPHADTADINSLFMKYAQGCGGDNPAGTRLHTGFIVSEQFDDTMELMELVQPEQSGSKTFRCPGALPITFEVCLGSVSQQKRSRDRTLMHVVTGAAVADTVDEGFEPHRSGKPHGRMRRAVTVPKCSV